MSTGTVEDVVRRLGRPLTPAQVQQAEYVLDQIESMIVERLGDITELVIDGVRLSTIASIEVEAAWRVMVNPDAKQNEKIDNYSYGLDASVASGAMYITDEEWERLEPQSVQGGGGAFSIRPSYRTDGNDRSWVGVLWE